MTDFLFNSSTQPGSGTFFWNVDELTQWTFNEQEVQPREDTKCICPIDQIMMKGCTCGGN